MVGSFISRPRQHETEDIGGWANRDIGGSANRDIGGWANRELKKEKPILGNLGFS
jgi:hypothetical protein